MQTDRIGIRGRWVTSAALRALAGLAPKAGSTFNRSELAVAMGQEPGNSTRKLLALQFVTMARGVDAKGRPVITYTVTPDGAAAIQAAAGGMQLVAGSGHSQAAAPGTLRARLWALLRIRTILDAEQAAGLLCDAGDPTHRSKLSQINAHLRGWHATGVLALSAADLGRGRKRYVLLQDPGPVAPPTHTRKGQR